jgi:peptidyl-dipeptidase A
VALRVDRLALTERARLNPSRCPAVAEHLGLGFPGLPIRSTGKVEVVTQAWHRLVENLEERFEELETQFHHAYWDSQVDASPESEKRRAELELELRTLKGDPDHLKSVEEALASDIHEPVLKRQLETLRLSLTGNQMTEAQRESLVGLSSSIENEFASFRPVVGDKRLTENEIEQTLRTSDDAEERREVWEASKKVGTVVAPRIRELARTRNEVARDLGFADYYSMALELQEMDEDWLFSVMAELESVTDEPFDRFKQDLDRSLSSRFGSTELRPWHYSDPFFQMAPPDVRVSIDEFFPDTNAPELATKTFGSWGIDISLVMESSDLYPRERKSQHAFCIQMDRRDDVRILANVVPGERWVEVMLHESGHAAYDTSINPHLPYLLRRPAHTFVTEAIAILSGRLMRDSDWLNTVAGVGESKVASISEELVRAGAAQSLVFTRWGLVMVHFERALYADPESDLDATWWELVERFQGVTSPPERNEPDWAAKIHVAVAPVYYHNYLLGEMLASQIEETCRLQFGGLVGSADAGDLLVERVFRPGASKPWAEVVETATGSPLKAEAYGERVTL